MIKELLYKWFNLEPPVCETCEVLREQLARVISERNELLNKLINKPEPIEPPIDKAQLKPIVPRHIPWPVRRQLLEAEDREAARLAREKAKEIEGLEKELEVN